MSRPRVAAPGSTVQMQVLVVVAPKNGVGCTTLVQRLALRADQAGVSPVVLLDADPAGDLTERYADKSQADLIFVTWDESCTGPDFRKLKTGEGLIIVDAPTTDRRIILRQTLSIADLIAVVVRPREDDFMLLGGVIDEIKAAAKPFVFVVNRAKRHGNMAAATAIALAQYGTVCPVILPEDERVAPSLRARVFRRMKRADGQIKLEEVWAYLSEQLAQCSAAFVAGDDEAGDDRADRRRFPRQDYDIGATFTWERQVFPCRIQNISAGGLAFTTATPLPIGTRLMIHIPYLGEFDAETVRADADVVGLRFVIDAWQQAGLVRDLSAMLGPGGDSGATGDALTDRKPEEGDVDEGAGVSRSESAAKRTSVKQRA